MKAHKLMPILSELREWLEPNYQDGTLTWKQAPAFKPQLLGKEAGTLVNGYRHIKFKGRYYNAHRILFAMFHGEEPDSELDHWDRNPANNSISNLRPGSGGVNAGNRRPRSRWGIDGVKWRPAAATSIGPSNAWRWITSVNGKVVYNGQDFFEACCRRLSSNV